MESRHGRSDGSLMKAVRKINERLLEQAAESRQSPLQRLQNKEHRCAIKVMTE